MFKTKIQILVRNYGIKHTKIMDVLGISRGTYYKKLKDNDFSQEEQTKLKRHFTML